MPLVFKLHLVMMSKYSKFGVDTFNIFLAIGYKELFHDHDDNDDDDNLAITIA